ncbi:unnamed protein product [Hermetia illucens]|uniref:Uncharacterized protein n=1 Tax=Hermetia illucens TaxID=343691 RepID=A0A7R8UVQ2_HERIL|nr:unnamed protein product [Hermetia illucens]
MEQCVAILTQILARQADNENQGVTIQKRIRNIVPFRGEPGTLVSFIGTIDGVVSEFGSRENEVYNIVYNEKITGAAKDFLAADFPVSWELCKQRLRSHFRPAKEWAVISKEITNIKVFTISQLVNKIQGIVNNVTECAAFSAESVEMANCLNSMLVVRIKELVAGSLAREISDLYSLESIRAVLYKYIGYDAYNLKKDRTSQNNYQHTHRQEKVNRFYNQRTDIVGGNIRRDDRQCYENQFGRRHNGVVLKDTEQVKTKCPRQFGQPDNARIRWTKIALNKEYDFLIGMDWLEKNVVSLDLMNQELVLKNDRKIPFVSKSMEEVILLLILMTTTTQAGLLTTSIDEQLGYLKLKVKTVQLSTRLTLFCM